MKFVTFSTPQKTTHTAVFCDTHQHSNIFKTLTYMYRVMGGEGKLTATHAGSMRFNGQQFKDYASSFSMQLGSGNDETTATLNKLVAEKKPLLFVQCRVRQVLIMDSLFFNTQGVSDSDVFGGHFEHEINEDDCLSPKNITVDFGINAASKMTDARTQGEINFTLTHLS